MLYTSVKRAISSPDIFNFEKLFLVLVLISSFFIAGAQGNDSIESNQNNFLTLRNALELSIQHNPSLKVFQFKDEALVGNYQTANLKPKYGLNVEAEQFAGTGELNGIEGLEVTVSLSSVIEMGGKRDSRLGLVSSKRNLLVTEKQIQSLDLLGEVTRRYIELLAAQEMAELAEDAFGLTKNSVQIVKKRVRAGATPAIELKRAEAANAQAELNLASERQQLNYRRIALAALWGERVFNFDSAHGNLFHFGNDVEFNTLYSKVERNPLIQVFAAQERMNKAKLRLIKTESSANVQWSVGIRQTQETNDTSLVAGFSMPLISSNRNRGEIISALAERNQTYVQREVAVIAMHSQLYRAYHNRKQAIITVEQLNQAIIPALKEAMTGTLAAYQQGRYGYLETVSARQELINAKRLLIEASSAALSYAAEIEQLTAEPIAATEYGEPKEFTGFKK